MRQKLGVTLAVAILALAGARETCKQFNQLKSLAGEWSGVWGTMLVYAGAYAEGVAGEPERQPLLAFNVKTPCPGGTTTATTLARTRRARARQTPRARREGAHELTTRIEELALGFAARPRSESAADKGSKRRAAAEEFARERAAEFMSALEAESPKSHAAGGEAHRARTVLPAPGLLRLAARAGAVWETARAERPGKSGKSGKSARVEKRFVFMLPELPLAGAETRRADDEEAEEWPSPSGTEAPAGSIEDEVFFAAPPPSGSGLLNCDVQPRR